MAFRKMLPLTLLAVLLVVPTAEAKYRVGIGDQSAAMFDSARWQQLKLKRTRYLVPWDWNKHPAQVAETTDFMNRARAAKQQVLVAFTARRGCWNGTRYSKSKACRAPSAKAYRQSFNAFDNAVPVGQDVLGLERGQPRVAAHQQQAGPRRALLRGAAQAGP